MADDRMALLAVVQEAYVLGVSTRRVDDLVRALGIDGVSRSQVSRMCAALDVEVEAFRFRSLSWTSQPRAMSANRNVRRGGPSGPPTLGGRDDPRHLRSGPYDIGVTRARGLDGRCRVIGQSRFLEATVALW